MIILQIEHPVQNYDSWKKAFDDDPAKRKESGVKSYRISKLTDDRNYLLIELIFDDPVKAEKMLSNLKLLWDRVEGKIMINPKARIAEIIETKIY